MSRARVQASLPPADGLPVRKRELSVMVTFADGDGMLQTPEGEVRVCRGDAILCDDEGRRWRLSPAALVRRYRPAASAAVGKAGRYLSLPLTARAWCMREPFEVLLADGVSLLQGQPGDWLLDYGDGELGIVAAAVFAQSYELLD